ncbi:MAG TPA: sigma-70 family RNA polymerase sigma factor [bacterium]|nr:sigma-70 family RNA polymerase sigma factor [bacterium]
MEPLDFDEVFKTYENPIHGYVLKMVGDETTADDLTQEIFVKVHRKLGSFEGKSKLSTWIYRIATNACLDHFRSSAHKRGKTTISLEEGLGPEDARACNDSTRIDDEVVRDEMGGCVREYVDALPGNYRAVIVLHDFQGLKNREIAEIMGCSLDTAKIRLHRARRRLEASLQSGCEFYRDENNVLRCDRRAIQESEEDV